MRLFKRTTTSGQRSGVGWSRGKAFLLSLALPGFGQLYGGKTIPAMIWLPAVVLGYLASPSLGLAAHGVCVFDATESHAPSVFEDSPKSISKRAANLFAVMAFALAIFSALVFFEVLRFE